MMGACSRVIVLAGPAGFSKPHLAERLGLPVLRLLIYAIDETRDEE